jgi:hypothetical protein
MGYLGLVPSESSLHRGQSLTGLVRAGETWRYEPPADHTISWVTLASGELALPERAEAVELVAFETSDQVIHFQAEVYSEFVLGSNGTPSCASI